MKRRTRVFAWFAIVSWVLFLLVGIAVVASGSSRHGGAVFFDVEGVKARGQLRTFVGILLFLAAAFLALGPPVGWVALLKKRTWAWRLLVAAYAAWVALALRMAGDVSLWGWRGVVLGLFLGLPLLMLLTDRPGGWNRLARAQGPSEPGRETAKAPRKRRKRPLTLVEWLVIVATLVILLAIILPALQRARPAARAARAVSAAERSRKANNYLLPP